MWKQGKTWKFAHLTLSLLCWWNFPKIFISLTHTQLLLLLPAATCYNCSSSIFHPDSSLYLFFWIILKIRNHSVDSKCFCTNFHIFRAIFFTLCRFSAASFLSSRLCCFKQSEKSKEWTRLYHIIIWCMESFTYSVTNWCSKTFCCVSSSERAKEWTLRYRRKTVDMKIY